MDDCEGRLTLSRRHVLGLAGALFSTPFIPRGAFAAGPDSDRRLLVIVLRGALDGLAAIPPLGDPSYGPARDSLLLSRTGPDPAFDLDGFFAAHPALPTFARLFAAGQALVVHAASTGYRERSHFQGQQILETGQPVAGLLASGFLNRAFAGLKTRDRVEAGRILGVGVTPPLVVRGAEPVIGWAPPSLPAIAPGVAERLIDLYAKLDPELGATLEGGLATDRFAREGQAPAPASGTPQVRSMRLTAASVAKLMRAETGPRLAALALDGWDTHSHQGGATGTLATLLGGLDAGMAEFETGFGPLWSKTAIAVVTEFGRTVRINGNAGSDHGTGTVMLLVGGAVKGGRVVTDWPGLGPANLLAGRDLKPTIDVRSVLKGLLAEFHDLPERFLSDVVFPGSAGAPILRGWV
jgi:uncharacterized protein (DUF1501 family)